MSEQIDNEKEKIAESQKRTLRIIFLIILLVFPIIYLFYKSSLSHSITEGGSAAIDNSGGNNGIISLENAVKANPTFDNMVNLSIAYINNNTPGKSIEYLNKAIELNPNSAIAYNNLGVANIMLQQFQNGIDACTKALQLDPTFQLAKNNLKWANDEKAKVVANIQIQEHEDAGKKDADFYLAYGLNYFKIGDYGKSIEIWNKVFDIDQKNTTALNNIGMAFVMKGQYEDAEALFKQVLKLEPDNDLAKNNLLLVIEKAYKSPKIK